ncbi:MAG: hypothetical protein QOJ28_1193, partial [Mycobacterium sp.]|nr:hypothetical protein [Mycobacterium sp.]
STACSSDTMAAVDGVGGLRSNNADSSAARAWATRALSLNGQAAISLNRLADTGICLSCPIRSRWSEMCSRVFLRSFDTAPDGRNGR